MSHRYADVDESSLAAPRELAQERGPERLGLGGTDVEPEDLAPAIAVDADRDDCRDAPAVMAVKTVIRRFHPRAPRSGAVRIRTAVPPHQDWLRLQRSGSAAARHPWGPSTPDPMDFVKDAKSSAHQIVGGAHAFSSSM
jgi:hypothetical protein